MKEKITLAVDVMSGDFGPKVIVPAIIDAARIYCDTNFILVGKRSAIDPYISDGEYNSDQISFFEASEVVEMDESPALAMRNKKDSSMRKSIELVKNSQADACISAGNTGALMAISRFVLGMCEGLSRPAIIHPMPSNGKNRKKVYVLDLGANVDCSSENLYQFALMGNAFAKFVANIDSPSLGLLNVGSEPNKGTDAIKKANDLINDDKILNYHGYVEGYDIFRGTVDVVVCDGFAGNVAIKASEGLAEFIIKELKQTIAANFRYKLCAFFAKPLFKRLAKRFDPNNYNGAAFLGLQGAVFKSHGGATKISFIQAINSARQGAKNEIVSKVKEQLDKHSQGN
ncbi:MAG: phosphate acyltransferase PlsX [Francisellaceae bacterium]|nr:phosphate acyltransferase PlsX [Francisellaceae bacterium]MBT6208381.1 phosphate acyltransferase PlsX [Francisellaceae bacterium]MBT6538174.1 phosphate acyltransferase PlsX [Francisellaceae bacterium]